MSKIIHSHDTGLPNVLKAKVNFCLAYFTADLYATWRRKEEMNIETFKIWKAIHYNGVRSKGVRYYR